MDIDEATIEFMTHPAVVMCELVVAAGREPVAMCRQSSPGGYSGNCSLGAISILDDGTSTVAGDSVTVNWASNIISSPVFPASPTDWIAFVPVAVDFGFTSQTDRIGTALAGGFLTGFIVRLVCYPIRQVVRAVGYGTNIVGKG